MFADLLPFHLQSRHLLERSHQATAALYNKNEHLSKINHELETFLYTASHDPKSPIHNIQGLINALSDMVAKEEWKRKRSSRSSA